MNPETTSRPAKEIVCRCGKQFTCGAATGHCWCFEVDAKLPLPADDTAACLCPDCLAAKAVSSVVRIRSKTG